MTPNSNLNPGFVSIDEAVALINSDTRQNPVVDMDYIASHAIWIETNHNFRIPKVRRLAPEEVRKTRYGKIVEYETTGEVNVAINTNYEKELLKKTIYDKYRELAGREYKEATLKARSTVADDAQGKAAVQPRNNKPIAKEGAVIGEGTTITSNGEGLLS